MFCMFRFQTFKITILLNLLIYKVELLSMDKILISIEGNLGSNKEIFIKFLQKYFKDNISYSEEQICTWENENLIKKFYKNQERWGFLMEVNSTVRKLSNLWNVIKSEKNKVIFTVRCPYSDKECFMKTLIKLNKIDKKEYETYNLMFNMLNMPKFNSIVYLKSNLNTSFERIKSKNRDCETNIDYNFIKELHNTYENWINQLRDKNVNIIEIDMDKYSDLEGSEEVQHKVMNILLTHFPKLKNYIGYTPFVNKNTFA